MSLDQFLMPEAQKAERRKSVGGSDANTILSGNADRIHALWLEKLNKGEAEPLSLNMLMGTVTEELNSSWYSHVTGDAVICRGETVKNFTHGFPMHATLDGMCGPTGDSLFEAKHTSGYDFQAKEKRTAETMAQYYMPQLQHGMLVTGARTAVLSVFLDNNRHEWVQIEADPFYQDGLIAAERKFWQHVIDKTPPVASARLEAKPKVMATKVVDFTSSNAFADFAHTWLETKLAHDKHNDAAAGLKSLIEPDVSKGTGHGVLVTKDKRGSIRISKA